MYQGKTMNINVMRQVCLSILHGKSSYEVRSLYKISRSTVIKYKKAFKIAEITEVPAFLALSDEMMVNVIYGNKAVIDRKPRKETINIGKVSPNHTKKDLYEADFKAYAKRYAEDHNVRKADIYVDYVKEATAHGKAYFKETAFRERLNEQILLFFFLNLG